MSRLFVIERNLDHNSVNFDKLAPWWAVGSPQVCLPSAPRRFLIFPDTFCFLLWNFLIALWRILVIWIPILTTSSIWLLFLLILIYLLILRLSLLLCFRIRWILNWTWLFWRYSFSNSFLLSRINIFWLRVRYGFICFILIFLNILRSLWIILLLILIIIILRPINCNRLLRYRISIFSTWNLLCSTSLFNDIKFLR